MNEREAHWEDDLGSVLNILLSNKDTIRVDLTEDGVTSSTLVDASSFFDEIGRLSLTHGDLWPIS